jgi:subtilisin family serine protease
VCSSDLGFAKGRLLVLPRAGLAEAQLDRILKPHGGKARRVGNSELRIVDLPGNASETAVLNLLAHNPHLKFVELDQRVAPDLVSNDPYLGSQWHVPRIGADLAWDASQGSGVTIAIIDSGVLPSHPDLAARLVPGWNFYSNNADTSDAYGHGTAVAGSAAAATNNGAGVAGVAGAARIMPIRVSDSTGYAYFSTIAQGVTFAADNGARVANASFASLHTSASVQSAAQYLKSKGGLLVVSAGNTGANDGAGSNSTMIPVSATDGNDALASWSSFGNYVAVAAPGVGIWTTSADGTYRSASGTSFAAPITAGVVALMMATKPTLSATQVESLLYSTALDLGSAGRDIYFGHGRVNAAAAVAAAAAATAQDTQAPSAAITSPAGGSSVSGLVSIDASASDNVGVSRVELRVNGSTVASDTAAPYQFSWDSASVANGQVSLQAYAFDAAGNSAGSTVVKVNVANGVVADTTAPTVTIANPADGSRVSGNVAVTVNATDNAGAAGLKQALYINGKLRASANGGSLSFNWNTRKEAAGSYTVQAVAQDAAGNTSSRSVTVTK